MKTLNELQADKIELIHKLCESKNPADILKNIKIIEAQIAELKTKELLTKVNAEQGKKRELARLAWEAEQPTEDITTNDGSLHKVKSKKYPKLSAIPYVRIDFKDGYTTQLNINGEKFSMYKTQYEYQKPTKYTRPATFLEFLQLNSIESENIDGEDFAQFAKKLNEANSELEKAIETYKQAREKLNVSQMQYIGLVSQQDAHLYIYEAKTR